MHLHLNEKLEITACENCSSLLKKEIDIPKTPFSIHLLQDKLKFLLLNNISQLELSKNTSLILSETSLKNQGFNSFEKIKINLKKSSKNNEYVVLFTKKISEEDLELKKYQPKEDLNKLSPLLSTNLQFERFFNRIEQVNTELERRNKVNAELISLNKQLLLKDQLLEKNKNNVEALLNNNLQAFVLVDTFYSIQAFNDKAKDLFLTISKKTIEKNAFFYDYFSGENLSTLKDDFKSISQENNHQFTVTRTFDDNTFQKSRTFRVNYTAVLDKDSGVRSISIGFLDITDLIDTRKELESSQNLISSVFNSTKMGIFIINNNGDIIDVNKGAAQNLDTPVLELKDLNIKNVFSEAITNKSFPFFKIDKEDIVVNWKSQEHPLIKTFSLRAELLRNDSESNLLIVTIRDISDEMLTKERLENITNNIPGVVFRYLLKDDSTDELLYVSDGAQEIWGFDKNELINNNQIIWDQYYPDDLEEHKRSIEASKETMSEWFHEWRYIHPKKGLRWQRGIGKPTEQLDGNTAWDSIIVDITDEKKTQLHLQEKTKYLTLLSQVNQELINQEEWGTTINNIFKLIGESMNVDRVYFFRYFIEDEIERMKQVFEWCSDKTFPQIDDKRLQNLPISSIPTITSAMKANKSFHAKLTDMIDSEEKSLLLESDIKSIYNVPITIRHKRFGVLGLDDCTREREWSEEETSFLATIAQNISIAYESHVANLELIKETKARVAILESIKDGFFSIDTNWVINYWNEEAQRLTGLSKQKAMKGVLWEVFPEINTVKIKESFEHAVRNKDTTILESNFETFNKWFELNIYPTDDGASIYFKDITDRKNKEKELVLSYQRFQKVTEATNDAVWEWDLINDTLYWGLGYEKQFGHKIENEIRNLKLSEDLIHPEDKVRVTDSLMKAIEEPNKTSWSEEYRYQNIDGSFSYVMNRGNIIRDKNDIATHVIGAMTDISHRKEYEESLEYLNSVLKNRADELTEMNLELERFAYIASHDLQEPLRMVTGFLTQLEKKYSDKLDEKASKYIFYAVDGAKRMRKIILDLLEYSRVGKIDDAEVVEVDLNDIINEVKTVLDQVIVESNATIRVSKLPIVLGDKLSFTQIFQNLISNAVKYRDEGVAPIIDIEFKENKENFIFSVADNGIGIEPKYQDKIFVIFQRLHNKDKYSGTGVGLAIVKKVVEQMGGEIWLESNKSSGSTFYFSVPKDPKLD